MPALAPVTSAHLPLKSFTFAIFEFVILVGCGGKGVREGQ
jgi:hypothetical protein